MKGSERGLSMLNMLVSMAIVGILGAIGLPQLATLSATFDRLNARTVFIQDLKQAQAQALTEGCRGIFTFSGGGTSYTFGCDYLSYDTDSPPVADLITFTRALPGDVSLTPSSQMIFNSRGLPVDEFDIISNITIQMFDASGGSSELFASGTLLGTGLFSYD